MPGRRKLFEVENYSTLTALCDDKGWSYNWLKTLKMPFNYKGYLVSRMKNQNCPSGQKWAEEKKLRKITLSMIKDTAKYGSITEK